MENHFLDTSAPETGLLLEEVESQPVDSLTLDLTLESS
jgi:hypothetical protein